jgi:uncharacterized membrane protein HdeD (DUF308 family)
MNIIERRLAAVLFRNWWVVLLRGLVAIAFGVLIWLQPAISLAALILLFGAYSMADGILGAWTAIAGRKVHDEPRPASRRRSTVGNLWEIPMIAYYRI